MAARYVEVKEKRALLAFFLNPGFREQRALRKTSPSWWLARLPYLSARLRPSVHASTALQPQIVRHSRRTDGRFPGAARHRHGHRGASRYRKRSRASLSTNSGRSATDPGRENRHPRALRTPLRIAPPSLGTSRYQPVVAVSRCPSFHSSLCRSPSRPLFDAYRTTWSPTSHGRKRLVPPNNGHCRCYTAPCTFKYLLLLLGGSARFESGLLLFVKR